MSHINFSNVTKEYRITNEITVKAVNDISFEIEQGEFVIILGASGAGKTTVLNLLGGMDSVSFGKIIIDNEEVSSFQSNELTMYRRNDVGFVFQFYNLIPDLTAIENVELATQVCINPLDPAISLKEVGLESRLYNFPSQLSGGEQQRVSIARAIAKNPKILLCDEPTGALDSETGKNVLSLLRETADKKQKTIIVVTHNAEFSKIADRVIRMRDGKIEEVIKQEKVMKVDELQW